MSTFSTEWKTKTGSVLKGIISTGETDKEAYLKAKAEIDIEKLMRDRCRYVTTQKVS